MQVIFTADYTLKINLRSHTQSIFSVLYFASKLLPESNVLHVEVLLLNTKPNGWHGLLKESGALYVSTSLEGLYWLKI